MVLELPRTISQFDRWFPDEKSCQDFLIQSRWPDGFCCPRCGFDKHYWKEARGIFQCRACGYQVSPTAGTIMHRSRMPLRMWFLAGYLITAAGTRGISALEFQRRMQIGSYETAFAMLHKLRTAMAGAAHEKLGGEVEVDETYVCGFEHGLKNRRPRGKSLVAGAVGLDGERITGVRLRAIPTITREHLISFVTDNVRKGSVIKTDHWPGYSALGKAGYHRVALSNLVNIHQVFADLETWLSGTHHGVSKRHLQAYLDEYCFRVNRTQDPGEAFQTVLGLTPGRAWTAAPVAKRD